MKTKGVYQVELYFSDGSQRTWNIWCFSTFKKAVLFGEFKYRTWESVEFYRIRFSELNPIFHLLSNPNYSIL